MSQVNYKNYDRVTDTILRLLDEHKVVKGDQIKLEGLGLRFFFEHREFLYATLNFPEDMHPDDAKKIASDAVFDAGRRGAIDKRNYISSVNRLTKAFYEKPDQKYVLATSLSLVRPFTKKRLKVNSATIIQDSNLPRKYQEEREKVKKAAQHTLPLQSPDYYQPVRIFVNARSTSQAADEALDAIDLIRGIWNFSFGDSFRYQMGGYRNPVNKIILGPLHTLHLPNGALATDSWWFETRFKEIPLFEPSSASGDLNKAFELIRQRLRHSSYCADLERAFIRCTRALDETDPNLMLVKLWGVLELLTNSSKDDNKITARRASFIFPDRDFYYQWLLYLSDYRNRHVHADADEGRSAETYVYQLKEIINNLIRFHLTNRFDFLSISEATEFLDLPPSLDLLKIRKTRAEQAMAFRTG